MSSPHTSPARIVAVPGFGGAGADYAPLQRRLVDWEWSTLTWPGSAGSRYCPNEFSYTPSDLIAWLSTHVRPTDIVMGYSMGGRLVLEAVAQGLIAKAICVIGAVPGIESAAARQARQIADEALAQDILRMGAERFATRWAEHPLIRTQCRIEAPYLARQRERRMKNSVGALAAALQQFGQGVVGPSYDSVCDRKIPALLVTGGEDTKYTKLVRSLRARWSDSEHAILDAGHAAHLEAPDEMAAAFTDFVDRRL